MRPPAFLMPAIKRPMYASRYSFQIARFFSDREPVGPYLLTVPPRRTLHLRFNDLERPEPIPRDTPYSSLFDSDVPIVVQYTRLDSRHAEVSLLSTTAYAEAAAR